MKRFFRTLKHTSNYHTAYLVAILILATLFRLLWLADIPTGFYVDEASTGYDAYAILLTGKDQYGEFLPVFARTFGAYNESLYRFITVIPVWLFGLTEFSVRLPAAIFGILTVPAIYLLAKELFDKNVALLAAFLMAISPWHIPFSRVGFRAILLPFFVCWGLYFFFRGRQKPRYLLYSATAFAIGLYTYASARVFIPLFLLPLVFLYRNDLKGKKTHLLWAAGIFALVFLFLAQYWLSPQGIIESLDSLDTDPIQLIKTYLGYFGPVFLFVDGDTIARHGVANFGQLHHFELVTVAVGLFWLLRERQKRTWLLLAWLILYPLPGSLTDATHALRTIIGIPVFTLISAYGLYKLVPAYEEEQRHEVGRETAVFPAFAMRIVAPGFGGTVGVARQQKRWVVVGLTAVIILWRIIMYAHMYFVTYPIYSPQAWQYGMREAIEYSASKPYDNIYISDSFFIPHMFVLFYNAYPPEQYQQEALLSVGEGNFRYTDVSIGNYHILSAEKMWWVERDNGLFMLFPNESRFVASRSDCEEVHVVRRPNGSVASVLVECHAIEARPVLRREDQSSTPLEEVGPDAAEREQFIR
ncbi:MAG: glycosyltransferase family 39 protein [Chloroflexota bacterium]